jgi:hypothetical protein
MPGEGGGACGGPAAAGGRGVLLLTALLSAVLARLHACAPHTRPRACTQGVAQLVLESPYYGSRRPAGQRGSKLCAVSDLLALGWWVALAPRQRQLPCLTRDDARARRAMRPLVCVAAQHTRAAHARSTHHDTTHARAHTHTHTHTRTHTRTHRATIYESLCLLHWLECSGVTTRGICGLSMGGVHAGVAGAPGVLTGTHTHTRALVCPACARDHMPTQRHERHQPRPANTQP